MTSLSTLPVDRQNYYKHLSDQIKKYISLNVDHAEWIAVLYFIEIHKTLEWCIETEKAAPVSDIDNTSLKIILNIIETKMQVDPPIY